MTVTCPAGHASATTDYCDVCGARLEAPPVAVAVDESPPDTSTTRDTSASPVSAPCQRCGAPRAGRDRFCEGCGFDFAGRSAEVEAELAWAATITPDRAYFDRTAPEGVAFPDGAPALTIELDGPRVRIGRRRSGEDRPELELADPAVSRLHATLVRTDAGSWAVVDDGSSNGTTLNEDPEPIAPHVEIVLREGDAVHVGAWTTITLALRTREA